MDRCEIAGEGRRRVIIENVRPSVDCGRFPIKRTVGEKVLVRADVFADGHDVVMATLLVRKQGSDEWAATPMTPLGNDLWEAEFAIEEIAVYEYAVRGWVDAFETWQRDLKKRVAAGQDIAIDLQIGAQLLGAAATRADAADSERLRHWQEVLGGPNAWTTYETGGSEISELMRKHPDLRFATESKPLQVAVDRQRARFSTWYELFPRSCSGDVLRHGTFRDCMKWLPRLAEMGFDVIYLPPIHPIGTTFRKGKNNSTVAGPDDVGSPWAIGASEGGHTAIHPDLGTLSDFQALLGAAKEHDIEIALDIAFQCSPDHPYVSEHPQWFRQRPDGTIQYAENPPKKYQDIYPFDFETEDWQALWSELTGIFLYWAEQGVRVFRVDNPHTKSLPFWEYCIAQVKAQYPDAIFLSEAFTRPKIMYRLAKLGFTQSYTYFTWRNTKAELTEYLTELTQTEVSEFFRPNLWPNTPDILPEHLQVGGRAAFISRLVMAATLSSNYGIYGPAFEALEHLPREAGSEEYLGSEKYQLRAWHLDRPEYLGGLIASVNRARRENPALQFTRGLEFHPTDNDRILCYSKRTDDGCNAILVVVSLNSHALEQGFIDLGLEKLGLAPERPYQLHDLLTGASFLWHGARNFVELNPHRIPAHIFRVAQA